MENFVNGATRALMERAAKEQKEDMPPVEEQHRLVRERAAHEAAGRSMQERESYWAGYYWGVAVPAEREEQPETPSMEREVY